MASDPLRRSSPALRARLRRLADRRRGPDAIALRSRPIPHAYRVLFRTLGMEPDVQRIPAEVYLLERLQRGGYPSRGVLPDALLIACVETEVGVWAVAGARELRLALAGERVVVACDAGTVAPVFAEPEPVGHDARVLTLFAVVAPAVPAIAVEEALWTAWDVVEGSA